MKGHWAGDAARCRGQSEGQFDVLPLLTEKLKAAG